MEEDIKILEELKRDILKPYGNEAKAIENLINKNKELEKENKQLKKYWGNKIAEYHKVIELMADYIDVYGECVNGSKKNCEETHCQKCIIDYFRKKAKGE